MKQSGKIFVGVLLVAVVLVASAALAAEVHKTGPGAAMTAGCSGSCGCGGGSQVSAATDASCKCAEGKPCTCKAGKCTCANCKCANCAGKVAGRARRGHAAAGGSVAMGKAGACPMQGKGCKMGGNCPMKCMMGQSSLLKAFHANWR